MLNIKKNILILSCVLLLTSTAYAQVSQENKISDGNEISYSGNFMKYANYAHQLDFEYPQLKDKSRSGDFYKIEKSSLYKAKVLSLTPYDMKVDMVQGYVARTNFYNKTHTNAILGGASLGAITGHGFKSGSREYTTTGSLVGGVLGGVVGNHIYNKSETKGLMQVPAYIVHIQLETGDVAKFKQTAENIDYLNLQAGDLIKLERMPNNKDWFFNKL